MASLSGVSSSNTISSLMNSANMISGLASGMDTEGMIESLVKSYQTKISQLNQKVTKTEWKQDAYRSIIQKMVGFSNKYTSYTSSTNLMSSSFFNNSVKVLTKGEFADSVTASGKTSSDISLDAVHQLARAAQYRTKSKLDTGDVSTIAAGKDFDLFKEGQIELSNLSGSLTLTYGSKTVDLSFSETTDVEAMNEIRKQLEEKQGAAAVKDSDVLAELINRKLADEKIVFNSGNAEDANKRIQAVSNGGSITFKELGSGQNGVYISGASGNIASQLGLSEEDLEDAAEKKPVTLDLSSITDKDGGSKLTRKLSAIDRLAELSSMAGGRTINMNLDGTTKQISAPHVAVEHNYDGDKYYINGEEIKAVEADPDKGIAAKSAKEVFAEKYTEALNAEVQKAFKGKVTVENTGTGEELKLEFKLKNEGSSLVINSAMGDAMGIGNTATSYLNTSKTLKDLLGDKLDGLTPVKDENGGLALTDKGKKQYDFTLNGVKIGTYSEDTQLSTILSDINSNKNAGVQAAYSQSTQNFTFTSKETGADSQIEMGEGLAQAMFGKADAANGTYTSGQDAIFTATINGEQKYMTRTSNSVNIDGLTINMTETFNSKVDANGDPVKDGDKFQVDNAKKSVTFQNKTDSDKIVDAIKSMVADYNTMMSEIKGAYSTMPYQKSNGTFANYEPLTDEDREGMSESAIERYEEKAKQGILFGDRNLNNLYTKMNQAFSFSNREDVDTLKDMGISVSYDISTNAQTVTIDEDKLRAMLDSDPDRVADLFTKNDGIMDRMKTQLDAYSKTTGEPKGILIQQSGSPLSSLSLMNNQWQKEIDNYNTQIEKWQDKLTAQVEKYTSQFSRLEQLIQQMNSQSSTLAGMMGG